MILSEKGYTNNPFVDNLYYYARLLAMNSVIKDQDEAIKNENKKSKMNGDILISCVEGHSTYEMFDNIPIEILEKYIPYDTNIDIYASNTESLHIHLDSLPLDKRTRIYSELSELARNVYIDHYITMHSYVNGIPNNWLDIKQDLYNNCINNIATYEDTFNELPKYTRYRILKTYLVNYDNMDIGDLASSIVTFKKYIDARSDSNITDEINRINIAMRSVFASHYEMMQDRNYLAENMFTDEANNKHWYDYVITKNLHDACVSGLATYRELFDYFPSYAIEEALYETIGQTNTDAYQLTRSVEVLEEYFEAYSDNPQEEQDLLNAFLRERYDAIYKIQVNFELFGLCDSDLIDYDKLAPYLPFETRKLIINVFIDEFSNYQVYSESKGMLNRYLAGLSKEDELRIKQAIANDMLEYFPSHFNELNNYYRSYLGLPPIDENGNMYEDTLYRSYKAETGEYITFGDKFIKMIPDNIYPKKHWQQPLYEYDSYDISILREYGVIDAWLEAVDDDTNSRRYKYINYIDNKLDPYICRKAENLELIYVPSIDDEEARKVFIDKYMLNWNYVIRTVYSYAYKVNNVYYNKFMGIFILLNAVADMVNEVQHCIINRDIFDIRCIQYIFEANGVPFYGEIPYKYLKAMLKNLNNLIKYKSSTRNMVDIVNLFGFSDINVFWYYMFKTKNIDSNSGQYLFQEDNDISYDIDKIYVRDDSGDIVDGSGLRYCKLTEYRYYNPDEWLKTICLEDGSSVQIINNDKDIYVKDDSITEFNYFVPFKDVEYFKKIKANISPYEVQFVKVPITDYFVKYKNDPENFVTYDEVTYNDEGNTWDGGLMHEPLKDDIKDYPFNAVITKYISVESTTDLAEASFQVTYFFNMLFDNAYNENNLILEIPFLSQQHKFRFVDVICYLMAMMYYYYGLEDNIMYSPTQILFLKGYNYDEALNQVIQDPTCFTQYDEYGPLEDIEKKNIFDINERINEDNYNYKEAFKEWEIKAFNLEADVDALETWLNENWQMSLDDFVINGTEEEFGRLLTLRQFYSLNNSLYQKSLFTQNIYPLQYNQDIKYAYYTELLPITYENDISNVKHGYATYNSQLWEVIDDISSELFILDNNVYGSYMGNENALYCHFFNNGYDETINANAYSQSSTVYYKYDDTYGYIPFVSGRICILDSQGRRIFGADNFYTKNADGTYSIVSDSKYFVNSNEYIIPNLPIEDIETTIGIEPRSGSVLNQDLPNNASLDDLRVNNIIFMNIIPDLRFESGGQTILIFGEYYIQDEDGKWIIDPNNKYVRIQYGDEIIYALESELDNYQNATITEEDCYIRHDDGHFIKLTDTDFYRMHFEGSNPPQPFSFNDLFDYMEEDCYIKSPNNIPTEYYDESENPRTYYMLLNEYHNSYDYIIDNLNYYVKDPYGNFIPVSSLLDPYNLYFEVEDGVYDLVINHLAKFINYEEPKPLSGYYIRNENNDYDIAHLTTYYSPFDIYSEFRKRWLVLSSDQDYRFVYCDNHEYIILLKLSSVYDDTNYVIIVFNKPLGQEDVNQEDSTRYVPEFVDKKWDENDWFYYDPRYTDTIDAENVDETVEILVPPQSPPSDPESYDDVRYIVGMNGENHWYYRKPGDTSEPTEEENNSSIGSGFYFPADAYLGEISLEYGEKYYMTFDIETNFSGELQIYNSADSSYEDMTSRIYHVRSGIVEHIDQLFTANNVERPDIRFLRYDYNDNQINIGDYVIVSNISFIKAYSENYMPKNIPSFAVLQDIYKTNAAIYKYLTTLMQNTSDYDTYMILKKIYDSLMLSKYNKEAFKLSDGTYAKTYTDFLQTRDANLYSKLQYYKTLEPSQMQQEVTDGILDVIYSIEDVINISELDLIYSYFPGASKNFILEYITKLIKWFKSWKVHMLGPSTTYKLGDQFENRVRALEDDDYRIRMKIKSGVFTYDRALINPIDALSPNGTPYLELFPDMYAYTDKFNDKVNIADRVRLICTENDKIVYKQINGRDVMEIILSDPDTDAIVKDNDLIIRSSNAGFETARDNQIIEKVEDGYFDELILLGQSLDEITRESTDIIEWEDYQDE